MKFQANVPFKLTKLFYEKLGEQPKDKSVLVIRDFFTAMHASIDNAVTFITDDKEAYELFSKNVVSNDEFGNDDTAIFVDTEINKNAWKDFIKELANMPKFDVAIMNPPYDGNLHLKIIEKVIPIADKVINISPANQFFAAKRLLKEYPLIQKSKVLKHNIVNIELIAPEIASNIFNAAFAGPLMILTYDANCKQSLNYMDYNVIPYNLRSVFDKTIRACDDKTLPNLYDEILKNTNKKFILPCPEVHGNQGKADWAEITSSDYARALKAKKELAFVF